MQQIIRLAQRVEQHPAVDHRTHLMQTIAQRGHNSKVPPAPAQPPEKLRVDAGAGAHQSPIRRHQIGRQQVIDGQSILTHQPAHPAPQGKTGDTGGRDQPARGGQALSLGSQVELAPRQARLGRCRAPRRVDLDAFHQRQVDHHPAVAGAKAGHVMPAAPHRRQHIVLTREPHRLHHIRLSRAADNQAGAPIDHSIPDPAGGFVFLISGLNQVTLQGRFQPLYFRHACHPDRDIHRMFNLHNYLLSSSWLFLSSMAATHKIVQTAQKQPSSIISILLSK